MALDKLNLLSVDLLPALDTAGFRHRGLAVEPPGAARIRAVVYEAEPGVPIWPYHFHRGLDELLYVISGAPVLREPGGERALAPGELVAFPAGAAGAHTLRGPGRFVIFSGEHGGAGVWTSAYPDSGKVSGPDGVYLRDSAVGYWHGEGTAGAQAAPAAARREPPPGPPRLAAALGAATPDEEYHYMYGRERWLLVLDGTATLRHPDGAERVEPGDLVCLPDGPAGAHALDAPVHALRVSTTGFPFNTHYPDSGRWVLHHAPGAEPVELG